MKRFLLTTALVLVTQYSYAASDIEITRSKDSQKILTLDLFIIHWGEMSSKLEGYLAIENSLHKFLVKPEWIIQESKISIKEKDSDGYEAISELLIDSDDWGNTKEFAATYNGKPITCKFLPKKN